MGMTQKSSEFEPLPVVPQPVLEGPLAALLEWQAMAEGAYSARGLVGIRRASEQDLAALDIDLAAITHMRARDRRHAALISIRTAPARR
jgi:hypothetical protein